MDSCLGTIRAKTRSELDIITDEPGNISGFTSVGRKGFGCKTRSTGTKGTYVEGWYEIRDKK
jgi:hypothetical protein